MAVRKFFVPVALAVVATCASSAFAQNSSGFVSGPLTWTPVLQLREAGVDSNVFLSPTDPKQDVTGALGGTVDASLQLPAVQIGMHGASEYAYFERYKSQEAVNSTVSARATLALSYFQPSFYGSFLHTKDRSSSEIDIRAPRRDHSYGAGLTMHIGQHLAVIGDANRAYTEYLKGYEFAGVDLAAQLNHRSSNVSSGLRVTLTPFTVVEFDGGFGLDEFTARPLNNTENIRGSVGVTFSPDAVVSGHATIGYHKMYPEFAQTAPGGAQAFTGLTSAVDLSYLLLGVTRFGVLFSHDTSYSISPTSSYYVSTSGGLDVTQTLLGPFTLNIQGSRELLTYPTSASAAAYTEFVNVYGGGLQMALSDKARITLNYDYSGRRSGADAAFNYDRRHIYTTVTYGF